MLICVEGLSNLEKTKIYKKLISKMPVIYINDLVQDDEVTRNLSKIANLITNLGKFNVKTEFLLHLSILSQKAYWINRLNNDTTILLVDSFALSIFVQFCDNQDLDENFIRDLICFFVKDIMPDYTIFIDSDLDTIIKMTNTSNFRWMDLSWLYQYAIIRNTYFKNIVAFSKTYHIVNYSYGETSEELTSSIILLIEDFYSKNNKLITVFKNTNNMVWISAGGRGTRLKAFTERCPKPLLKFGDNYLLEYLCKYLISIGFSRKIFVSYCYLKEMWTPFINTYQNHIFFSDSTGIPNLVADLLQCVKNTAYDNYVVISGDVIFDFSIISDLLEKHCRNGNDVSLALNYSKDNQWKFWNYVIDDTNNILDIVKKDTITYIERYCLIINRKVFEKYTSSFSVNMGIDNKEFMNYEKFNSGWTYLVKRIIDYGSFIIKGYFYDKPVINVNAQDDLLKAKEYLNSHKTSI